MGSEADGSSTTAVLLLICPDQQGIVAAVAGFLADHHANIVHAEQHVDAEAGVFFQRVEFQLDAVELNGDRFRSELEAVGDRFGMRWQLRPGTERPRVAILCSKLGHCLYDLLARWALDEFPGELALVASNHDTHQIAAERADVAFHHLPVDRDEPTAQPVALLDLLRASGIDLVVMARYMQILPVPFIDAYPNRIINIHHSFLPAFPGGRPYHQAHARGVKLIGATAHYATADLDEGPIIEQDVTRVSHRMTPGELAQRGRDLEMLVLARAVHAHLENRILVYDGKTVVFS